MERRRGEPLALRANSMYRDSVSYPRRVKEGRERGGQEGGVSRSLYAGKERGSGDTRRGEGGGVRLGTQLAKRNDCGGLYLRLVSQYLRRGGGSRGRAVH